MRRAMCSLATVLLLSLALSPLSGAWGAAQRTSGTPSLSAVLPPASMPYGMSYGEWSALWWQWALGISVSNHPLLDLGGCEVGQSGPVWFLGGAFTGTATTRECTAPSGKAIFFPILNAECSTVEAPPFYGGNEEELRSCAIAFMDYTDFGSLRASVDGQEIANLNGYRFTSPMFDFTLPADNLMGLPAGTAGSSVSDGVWLMLTPLSAGRHTIHFEGSIPAFAFTLDVTYQLTVLGGHGRGVIAADDAVPSTWGRVKNIYR